MDDRQTILRRRTKLTFLIIHCGDGIKHEFPQCVRCKIVSSHQCVIDGVRHLTFVQKFQQAFEMQSSFLGQIIHRLRRILCHVGILGS